MPKYSIPVEFDPTTNRVKGRIKNVTVGNLSENGWRFVNVELHSEDDNWFPGGKPNEKGWPIEVPSTSDKGPWGIQAIARLLRDLKLAPKEDFELFIPDDKDEEPDSGSVSVYELEGAEIEFTLYRNKNGYLQGGNVWAATEEAVSSDDEPF